jgi:hypothetical protein
VGIISFEDLKWIIFLLRGEDGEKVFPKEACG